MQLFTGQATRLSSATQDGTLHVAQLCSLFTLLGAMPQCLRAEADAILAMIRSARETDQEQGDEACPEGDKWTRLLLWTLHALLQCSTCEEATGINQSQEVVRCVVTGASSQAHCRQGCPKTRLNGLSLHHD